MGWTRVLETVAPVFTLVVVGYGAGRLLRFDLRTITDIVVYLGGPALIFTSLMHGRLATADVAIVAAGAVTIVVGVGTIVLVLAAAMGFRPGALYLPAMFMNAGNMLLPLSLFAFGDEGLRCGVIVFVTVAMLQSSLGVTIASGRPTLTEMFRLPYIYAVGAAFVLRSSQTALPAVVDRPLSLLGDVAIPLMLLALGLRLRSVRVTYWHRPVLVAMVRVAGGYGVALAFVTLAGVHGTSRACLLLASVMPSAVINFVFAEKYGNESGEVATAVMVSTLVSLLTTPLVLAYGI
jgi:predicted permease